MSPRKKSYGVDRKTYNSLLDDAHDCMDKVSISSRQAQSSQALKNAYVRNLRDCMEKKGWRA